VPFNSRSYYRNKWRREALAELDQAREIKRRVIAGDAYEWEAARIGTCAKLARSTWRLYLSQREICRLYEGMKKR
jgi:hypothetical protein